MRPYISFWNFCTGEEFCSLVCDSASSFQSINQVMLPCHCTAERLEQHSTAFNMQSQTLWASKVLHDLGPTQLSQ